MNTPVEPRPSAAPATGTALRNFKDRVVIMSGGSRGIGLAIAKTLASEGAKVAIIAKTDQPHPKLEGTIHTAATEIEEAGGDALALLGDVRDEARVEEAVAETVARFGGIDIVVNNASAINLAPMADLEVKRFDLMQQINARGTFVLTKAALPHLRRSDHAHVLTLSPPLSTDTKWLRGHSAYTLPMATHHHRHRSRTEPARRRRSHAPRAYS
jgi:citronellol/citronellal dehydrogenase